MSVLVVVVVVGVVFVVVVGTSPIAIADAIVGAVVVTLRKLMKSESWKSVCQ